MTKCVSGRSAPKLAMTMTMTMVDMHSGHTLGAATVHNTL